MILFPHLTIDRQTVKDTGRLHKLSELRSIDAQRAFDALVAVEAGDFSEQYTEMNDCKTAEQALKFAEWLRDDARELELESASENPNLCSQPGGVAKALATLYEAADWYKVVGRLGFGVYVVY